MTLWKWLVCTFPRHYSNKQVNLITSFSKNRFMSLFSKTHKQISAPNNHSQTLYGLIEYQQIRVCEAGALGIKKKREKANKCAEESKQTDAWLKGSSGG